MLTVLLIAVVLLALLLAGWIFCTLVFLNHLDVRLERLENFMAPLLREGDPRV